MEKKKKQKYTLAAFCKARGFTPEWLASEEGHLVINEMTKRLPDEELIIGGDLIIDHHVFSDFPDKVIVGGNLKIRFGNKFEFPAYFEVMGDVKMDNVRFDSIHEGCHFHRSVTIIQSWFKKIRDNFHVHGSLDLTQSTFDALPRGLVVDEVLTIAGTRITEIPEDCLCRSMDAQGSKLCRLPACWKVEDLNLDGCPIFCLSDGVEVTHSLKISRTLIRQIGQRCQPVILIADESPLTRLPDQWTGSYVILRGCPIRQLPNGLVADHLNISRTRIQTIPADCIVHNVFIALYSELSSLPENFVVSDCLDVRGSHVSLIPAGVICRSILCDKDTQVDAYQFDSQKEADFHPNGRHVLCEGILSELIEHDGNTWKTVLVGTGESCYIVTDGAGHYAQGYTRAVAESDLAFKLQQRDTSRYAWMNECMLIPLYEACACYRTITGVSQLVIDLFCKNMSDAEADYCIWDFKRWTEQLYGHNQFVQFFAKQV